MRFPFGYFDKIYCINLKTRPDRWENCKKQFSLFGVSNFQRFEAVKYNNSKLSKKANAQIGCALSHYQIIKEAKTKNYSRILVLEDDFSFVQSPEILNIELNKSIEQLPLDWHLFYLGAYFVKGYDYQPIEKYSNNLIKVNTGFCTHALSYSLLGINKILENLNLETESQILYFSKEFEAIDWYFVRAFQYENNCFASKEFLCGQLAGLSDIEGKVFDYFKYFSNSYSEFLSK